MITPETGILSPEVIPAAMRIISDHLTTMRLVANGDISPRYLLDNPHEVASLKDAEADLRSIAATLDEVCKLWIDGTGILDTAANKVLVEIRRDGFLRIEGIGITGPKTGTKRRLTYCVAYSPEFTKETWKTLECGFVSRQSVSQVIQPQSCDLEGYEWISVAWRGAIRDGLFAHARSLPADLISPEVQAAHFARVAAEGMYTRIRGVMVSIENLEKMTADFSSAIHGFDEATKRFAPSLL